MVAAGIFDLGQRLSGVSVKAAHFLCNNAAVVLLSTRYAAGHDLTLFVLGQPLLKLEQSLLKVSPCTSARQLLLGVEYTLKRSFP